MHSTHSARHPPLGTDETRNHAHTAHTREGPELRATLTPLSLEVKMSNCPQVGGLLTRRAAQETDSYTLSLTLGDEAVTRLSRRTAEVSIQDGEKGTLSCSIKKMRERGM